MDALHDALIELRKKAADELGVTLPDDPLLQTDDYRVADLMLDKIADGEVNIPCAVQAAAIGIVNDFVVIYLFLEVLQANDSQITGFGYAFNVTDPDSSEYGYFTCELMDEVSAVH